MSAGQPTPFTSLSGDSGQVAVPEDLVGRLVTFMLTNATVVVAARIEGVDLYDGRKRLVYQLPHTLAASKVSVTAIGHLYVWGREHEEHVLADPMWHVTIACPPAEGGASGRGRGR